MEEYKNYVHEIHSTYQDETVFSETDPHPSAPPAYSMDAHHQSDREGEMRGEESSFSGTSRLSSSPPLNSTVRMSGNQQIRGEEGEKKKKKSCVDKLKGLSVFTKILVALITIGAVLFPIFLLKKPAEFNSVSFTNSSVDPAFTKRMNTTETSSKFQTTTTTRAPTTTRKIRISK